VAVAAAARGERSNEDRGRESDSGELCHRRSLPQTCACERARR
jgi:hypothetical protein